MSIKTILLLLLITGFCMTGCDTNNPATESENQGSEFTLLASDNISADEFNLVPGQNATINVAIDHAGENAEFELVGLSETTGIFAYEIHRFIISNSLKRHLAVDFEVKINGVRYSGIQTEAYVQQVGQVAEPNISFIGVMETIMRVGAERNGFSSVKKIKGNFSANKEIECSDGKCCSSSCGLGGCLFGSCSCGQTEDGIRFEKGPRSTCDKCWTSYNCI